MNETYTLFRSPQKKTIPFYMSCLLFISQANFSFGKPVLDIIHDFLGWTEKKKAVDD